MEITGIVEPESIAGIIHVSSIEGHLVVRWQTESIIAGLSLQVIISAPPHQVQVKAVRVMVP